MISFLKLALLSLMAAPSLANPVAQFTYGEPSAMSVLTPRGWLPAENVHEVPEGGQVVHDGDDVYLFDANRNVLHVAKIDATWNEARPTVTSNINPPIQSGWVTYAHWYNQDPNTPINFLEATWRVPPPPTYYDGQTVFYFPSIEPAGYSAILQPVLQYGPSAAGGGNYWTTASWYVVGQAGADWQAYYTQLANTTSGTLLHGAVGLTGQHGTRFNYVSAFDGQAPLGVSGIPQLVWATMTLEVYNIGLMAHLPNTHATSLYSINLRTTTGTPTITWSTVSDTTDLIYTTVEIDGATNAQVSFQY